MEEKILRRLVIKPFSINEVKFGKRFGIKGDVLEIVEEKIEELKASNDLITNIRLEIIKPEDL